MKKSFISTLLVVISSVFLASCVGQNTNQNQNQNQNNVQAPQQQNREQVMNEWQKLADAIAEGESVRCQIRHRETNRTGEYYMKGENIRYTFQNSDNPEENGSFISDSEYVYSWSEAEQQGMKFRINNQEQTQEQAQNVQDSEQNIPDFSDEASWNEYQNLGYTVECEVEAVDDSEFVPPTDIEFMDFTEMMQGFKDADGKELDPEQYRGMMGQ